MKKMLQWVIMDYFFPTKARDNLSWEAAEFAYHFVNGHEICFNRHIIWTWMHYAKKKIKRLYIRFPTIMQKILASEGIGNDPRDDKANIRRRPVGSTSLAGRNDEEEEDDTEPETEYEAAMEVEGDDNAYKANFATADVGNPAAMRGVRARLQGTAPPTMDDIMIRLNEMNTGMNNRFDLMQGSLKNMNDQIYHVKVDLNAFHTHYDSNWMPPSAYYPTTQDEAAYSHNDDDDPMDDD